jgi:hypothetical protein
MRRFQFSLVTLMAIGPLLAVNYAGFRYLAERTPEGYLTLYTLTTALPMASILVLGLLLAVVRRPVPPFLLGFEVVGFAAMAFALAAVFWRRDWVDSYITTVMTPLLPAIDSAGVKLGIPRGEPKVWENIWRVTGSALQTLPQLVLAMVGGVLHVLNAKRRPSQRRP